MAARVRIPAPATGSSGKATGMPSPMSLAASFSGRVAYRHARVVGDEVKRKGNDVVFAPAVNLMRTRSTEAHSSTSVRIPTSQASWPPPGPVGSSRPG